jgi:hypothetical protein
MDKTDVSRTISVLVLRVTETARENFIKIVYECLISPGRDARSAHLILLDLSVLRKQSEEYKLCSSSCLSILYVMLIIKKPLPSIEGDVVYVQ